jgi:hypothetical protein
MKKNLLVLTALTLSSAATLTVQAQPNSDGPPPVGPATHGNPGGSGVEGGPGGDDARRQEHRQRMLQEFDTNHDGQLDDNERAQMRQAMQKRRAQKQGAGPGGAGSGEHGIGQAGEGNGFNNPRRQMMMQKFDANHDGQLDDSEKAQMHEFMQRRRQERMQGGGVPNAMPHGGPGVPSNGSSPDSDNK